MILEPGWTKYEETNSKDKILPNLNIGDKVNHIFKPKEKETTPPKHYTIETLNNYLKNPFKEDKKKLEEDTNEEIDDVEEYKAIFEGLELGTEATRTGIIDNARKSKYIELKKDVYYILPDGEYLIESLIHMGISMDKYKTSELGKALKKVFHDEITVDDSVKLAEKEISEVFDKKDETPFFGDVVGTCPYCGKNMKITKYSYACEDYKECKFNINYYICKKYITKDIFDKLIKDGKTDLINGFTSKQGKEFSAMLTLENKKINFLFK
jgi:DNA topoisomerase-3